MNDFDIILGMDLLHKYYDFRDCRNMVGRLLFPNEIDLVWEGYNLSRSSPLISNLKANKMILQGLLCHVLSVNYLDHDIPSANSMPVVNQLQDVFPNDFLGVPTP